MTAQLGPDATLLAAAWSGGQARQRWRITVGWSQLVARGRHDMVLVELELQHYLELKHIDEHMRSHWI